VNIVSATLLIRGVYGSAELKGYRAANDTVLINLTSTSDVTSPNVSCTKIDGTNYNCIITDSASKSIMSYPLNNTNGDSATASISVDNNIGSVSYTISNSGRDILLEYNIQDLGFNTNNICSGISSVDIYDGQSVINTIYINGSTGTCMYTGKTNLSIANSGTRPISLFVKDNVGNTRTTVPQNVSVDVSNPIINNGLGVKYAGRDEEIETISSTASFLVDVYFSFTEDNPSNITLDLSNINNNPAIQYVYRNYDVSLSNCQVNTSETIKRYDCILRSIPMKTSSNTLNINVTVSDVFGNYESSTLTKSFTIDDVVPQVSIQTDHCDTKGRCYVKNGINNFTLKFNKQNFDKKMVFFNVPGSIFGINRVQNCTAGECTASVQLTCSSNEFEVRITSQGALISQDDAGNVIADYSTTIYCDNNAPTIENITVNSVTSSVLQDVVSGSTITLTAAVSEFESDEILAYAWLDLLKNSTEKGTCVKRGNYNVTCTWTVSNINAGYYQANVLFNVSDIAENTAQQSYSFKVFGFKGDNETPDNIGIRLKNVYPEQINRVVLDMATSNAIPYYVYATYDLNVIKGNEISVLYQNIDISKCTYVGSLGTVGANNVFSEVKINNPYAKVDEVGRIDLKFNDNTDPNILDNDFIISCNVSVIVKEGNDIFKNPQQLQLDIPFTLINTKLCKVGEDCTPGAVFGQKIKEVEDNWLVKAELMGTLNKWIPKLQSICKLRDYFAMAKFFTNLASVAANAVDISLGTGGTTGQGPVNAFIHMNVIDQCLSGPKTTPLTDDTLNMMKDRDPKAYLSALQWNAQLQNEKDAADKCSGIIGDACDFLSCNIAGQINGSDTTGKIPDLFGKDEKKGFVEKFGSEAAYAIDRNSDVPDVSNSMMAAVTTKCYPAMYYNLNKWRQTDCNYLYCLKMASYSGTDIAACDKAKFAQQCSTVVGEAFELPIARKVKNWMNGASDLVKNSFPLMLTSGIKRVACGRYISFDTAKGIEPQSTEAQTFGIYACQIPLQVATFVDMTARNRRSATFNYPEIPDMCEYAQCIGEPNCKHEQDFWDTLNRMNIPVARNMTSQFEKSQKTAETNRNIVDLRKLRGMEATRILSPNDFKQADYDKLVADLKSRSIISSTYGSARNAQVSAIDTQIASKKAELANLNNVGDLPYTGSGSNRAEKAKLEADIADLERQKTSIDVNTDANIKEVSAELRKNLDCKKSSTGDCSTVLGYSGTGDTTQRNLALTMTDAEYQKLPIQDRLFIDDQRKQAVDRLDALNEQLGGSALRYHENLPDEVKDQLAERKGLLSSMGLCGPGTAHTDCDAYNIELTKSPALYTDMQSKVKTRKDNTDKWVEVNNAYIKAEQFGSTLQTALQFLHGQNMLNWMFTSYWTEKWFGKDYSSYLDFDKRKESICNPDNPTNFGDILGTQEGSEGSIISCNGGNCRPVLTYATERTELEYPNKTRYNIYTVVYYIDSGDLKGHDLNYTVVFKGDGITIKGYRRGVPLKPYDVKSVHKVFKTKAVLNQICIKFGKPGFPVGELSSEMEYCREITSNTFSTGTPWSPEQEAASTGNFDEFDDEGNIISRGRNSGSTGGSTEPPGVLE
jgi:hypothetical protein